MWALVIRSWAAGGLAEYNSRPRSRSSHAPNFFNNYNKARSLCSLGIRRSHVGRNGRRRWGRWHILRTKWAANVRKPDKYRDEERGLSVTLAEIEKRAQIPYWVCI